MPLFLNTVASHYIIYPSNSSICEKIKTGTFKLGIGSSQGLGFSWVLKLALKLQRERELVLGDERNGGLFGLVGLCNRRDRCV